jgi:hypothetical protein
MVGVINRVKYFLNTNLHSKGGQTTTWEKFKQARSNILILTIKNEQKRKSVQLRHAGTKGERRYSSYSFSTSALDMGEWSAPRPGWDLPLGKDPRYPLDRRLAGPQSWSGHRGKRQNPLHLWRIEPWSRHYTDWAISAPTVRVLILVSTMGIFVTKRSGTPFRKFFLRRRQAGTASQNLFYWHRYN